MAAGKNIFLLFAFMALCLALLVNADRKKDDKERQNTSCYKYNIYNYGTNIVLNGLIRNVAADYLCQIQCQWNSKCVYWTYTKGSYMCQLKSDVGTNTTSSAYTSGAKYC